MRTRGGKEPTGNNGLTWAGQPVTRDHLVGGPGRVALIGDDGGRTGDSRDDQLRSSRAVIAASARLRILTGSTTGVPRVIMLTTYDLDQYVYAALRAGASGFLLKDVPPEHLVAAVRLVRSGDALLAPAITRRLVERFASRESQATTLHGDLSTLTPRELEVLQLLAKGLSNAELAARFQLSDATVKSHVARILSKLHLRDRAQAVVVAYETGLITPGGTSPPAAPSPTRSRNSPQT